MLDAQFHRLIQKRPGQGIDGFVLFFLGTGGLAGAVLFLQTAVTLLFLTGGAGNTARIVLFLGTAVATARSFLLTDRTDFARRNGRLHIPLGTAITTAGVFLFLAGRAKCFARFGILPLGTAVAAASGFLFLAGRAERFARFGILLPFGTAVAAASGFLLTGRTGFARRSRLCAVGRLARIIFRRCLHWLGVARGATGARRNVLFPLALRKGGLGTAIEPALLVLFGRGRIRRVQWASAKAAKQPVVRVFLPAFCAVHLRPSLPDQLSPRKYS